MEEKQIEKPPKNGYHQEIMDKAYKNWDKNVDGTGRGESMESWFRRLTDLQKDAVAIGKFNQQVCNGGFSQWCYNGYMAVEFDQLKQALNRLPQEEVVKKIKEILIQFEEIAQRNEWGEGSYKETEYEECMECNGSGTIYENGENIDCDCNDGQYEYEEKHMYIDELSRELRSENLDDKYYNEEEEFLKVCEEYFKKCSITDFVPDYEYKTLEKIKVKKPKVKLVGEDGNAFSIMGRVKQALRKGNWSEEEMKPIMEEMRSGDYDKLLQTAMKYCEVS